MNTNPWEVWLAYVEFDDGDDGKKRPVVIIDDYQGGVVALEMTSRPPKSFDEFVLSDWERVGVKKASTIKTNKELRLSNKSLIHKVGDLGTRDINTILEMQTISRPVERREQQPTQQTVQRPAAKRGCYVATVVYGSYNCPSVWVLRRYRDDSLSKTWYGRGFIKLYYAVSPIVVKRFGKMKWFNRFWKNILDKFVGKLMSKGYNDVPYYDDK